MFTGIVEAIGVLAGVAVRPGGRRLTIEAAPISADLAPGASVAVNGVCLTVAAIAGPRFDFDAVSETISRSNLADLRRGDQVNLERSLRADSRLDGHVVQGHVDGMATLAARRDTPQEQVLEFEPDPALLPYLVPKGSVAVDGVSLTVAAVHDRRFSVALVPTTIRHTTLWARPVGATLNVETDILVRTVIHWLRQGWTAPAGSGLTPERLQELGFA
jgi:riboflavin synthase alpha subunit